MIFGIVIFIVILLLSIILHELAHGVVADRLGDPTARVNGRLTLNPLPHLDPLGSIILPFVLILSGSGMLFGWAKPVPVDIYNLKNPRRDMALIAFAGPLTNVAIAFIASLILRLLIVTGPSTGGLLLADILVMAVRLNIVLALFNLIPIHPLDGFKVVGGLLSREKASEWYGLERYGLIFLLLLIIPIGQASMIQTVLQPVVTIILRFLIPGSL